MGHRVERHYKRFPDMIRTFLNCGSLFKSIPDGIGYLFLYVIVPTVNIASGYCENKNGGLAQYTKFNMIIILIALNAIYDCYCGRYKTPELENNFKVRIVAVINWLLLLMTFIMILWGNYRIIPPLFAYLYCAAIFSISSAEFVKTVVLANNVK